MKVHAMQDELRTTCGLFVTRLPDVDGVVTQRLVSDLLADITCGSCLEALAKNVERVVCPHEFVARSGWCEVCGEIVR